MKKKILFVNHEESRTGAPKILFDVASAFRWEYNIVMVSKKQGSMHEEFIDHFERIIYPHDFSKEAIKDLIKSINPDLAYINTMSCFKFAEAAKALGIPTIFHLHELNMSIKPCLSQEDVKNFPDSADIFIACSGKVKDFLVSHLRCEASKVRIVYSFISYDDTINKSTGKGLSISKAGQVIMGMGSIRGQTEFARKGIDFLMDACSITNANGCHNLGYYWIGSVPEIFTKTTNQNFQFLGEQKNPFALLRKADIFVMCSREEPLGLAALEAMALGKPVIAFKDGGGIVDAIGDCGIIVDEMSPAALAMEIEALSKDPQLRLAMGKKSKEKVKANFDKAILIPQFKQLIKEVIR
ncbi:MAG: glycosyltransferase [Nanoarchaeota archaeon]|nr:glycosyltransferase [Nanoarchaeota archaeon]MBU1703896.1 glycosyltransferase [Nanoarchaeota archaeon]